MRAQRTGPAIVKSRMRNAAQRQTIAFPIGEEKPARPFGPAQRGWTSPDGLPSPAALRRAATAIRARRFAQTACKEAMAPRANSGVPVRSSIFGTTTIGSLRFSPSGEPVGRGRAAPVAAGTILRACLHAAGVPARRHVRIGPEFVQAQHVAEAAIARASPS